MKKNITQSTPLVFTVNLSRCRQIGDLCAPGWCFHLSRGFHEVTPICVRRSCDFDNLRTVTRPCHETASNATLHRASRAASACFACTIATSFHVFQRDWILPLSSCWSTKPADGASSSQVHKFKVICFFSLFTELLPSLRTIGLLGSPSVSPDFIINCAACLHLWSAFFDHRILQATELLHSNLILQVPLVLPSKSLRLVGVSRVVLPMARAQRRVRAARVRPRRAKLTAHTNV